MFRAWSIRAAAALAAAACLAALPARAQDLAVRAEIAKGLKQTPVFVVLEQHYPAVFKQAVDAVETGLAKGRPMQAMQAEIRTSYVKLLAEQMPKAEGGLILQAIRITRDQGEALASSPQDCLAVYGVAEMDRMAQAVLPAHLIKVEQAWAAELLRQTAERPVARTVKPLADETLQRVALTAYDALSADDYRRRITRMGGEFTNLKDPADKAAVCEFNIQIFSALAEMPAQEAVDTFLSLNAQPK